MRLKVLSGSSTDGKGLLLCSAGYPHQNDWIKVIMIDKLSE